MVNPPPQRRSRRARKEPPEVIPKKSDPDQSDDEDVSGEDENSPTDSSEPRRVCMQKGGSKTQEKSEVDDSSIDDEKDSESEKRRNSRRRRAPKSPESPDSGDVSSEDDLAKVPKNKIMKRRVRPRKTPEPSSNDEGASGEEENTEPLEKLKRRRGRPRKTPEPSDNDEEEIKSESFGKAKRRRGRPRKTSEPSSDEGASNREKERPKRRRGRPRKTPEASSNDDASSEEGESESTQRSKRQRGRPRRTQPSSNDEEPSEEGKIGEVTQKITRRSGRTRKFPENSSNDESPIGDTTRATRRRGRSVKAQKVMDRVKEDSAEGADGDEMGDQVSISRESIKASADKGHTNTGKLSVNIKRDDFSSKRRRRPSGDTGDRDESSDEISDEASMKEQPGAKQEEPIQDHKLDNITDGVTNEVDLTQASRRSKRQRNTQQKLAPGPDLGDEEDGTTQDSVKRMEIEPRSEAKSDGDFESQPLKRSRIQKDKRESSKKETFLDEESIDIGEIARSIVDLSSLLSASTASKPSSESKFPASSTNSSGEKAALPVRETVDVSSQEKKPKDAQAKMNLINSKDSGSVKAIKSYEKVGETGTESTNVHAEVQEKKCVAKVASASDHSLAERAESKPPSGRHLEQIETSKVSPTTLVHKPAKLEERKVTPDTGGPVNQGEGVVEEESNGTLKTTKNMERPAATQQIHMTEQKDSNKLIIKTLQVKQSGYSPNYLKNEVNKVGESIAAGMDLIELAKDESASGTPMEVDESLGESPLLNDPEKSNDKEKVKDPNHTDRIPDGAKECQEKLAVSTAESNLDDLPVSKLKANSSTVQPVTDKSESSCVERRKSSSIEVGDDDSDEFHDAYMELPASPAKVDESKTDGVAPVKDVKSLVIDGAKDDGASYLKAVVANESNVDGASPVKEIKTAVDDEKKAEDTPSSVAEPTTPIVPLCASKEGEIDIDAAKSSSSEAGSFLTSPKRSMEKEIDDRRNGVTYSAVGNVRENLNPGLTTHGKIATSHVQVMRKNEIILEGKSANPPVRVTESLNVACIDIPRAKEENSDQGDAKMEKEELEIDDEIDGNEEVPKETHFETVKLPFKAFVPSLAQAGNISVSSLYNYKRTKLNRVKAILYSSGSKVHRGRGFERIFAQYWEAVSLRLSDRLSTHSSRQCELAVKAFLKSPKLRKLHNKLITSIMKRAIKSFAPLNDVSRFIPMDWHDRVKKIARMQVEKTPARRRVPRPPKTGQVKNKTIYREAWGISNDHTDHYQPATGEISNQQINFRQLRAASSSIPGALVVDPLVREMASRNNMCASENAVWLLIIAVREHTKNVLKNALIHKEVVAQGEIPSPFLQYPKVLAGAKNASKRDSSQGKQERTPQLDLSKGQDKKKKLISSLDIYTSSSTSMPIGPAGSLGGSISSTAVERCLYSAYDSYETVQGRDFLTVQNYIKEEMLSLGRERDLLLPDPTKGKLPTDEKERENSQRKEQSISRGRPQATRLSPGGRSAKADVGHISSRLQPQPTGANIPDPKAVVATYAAVTPPHSQTLHTTQAESLPNQNTTGRHPQPQYIQTTQQPIQSSRTLSTPISKEEPLRLQERTSAVAPVAGLGRGAKNLAALMQRASTKSETPPTDYTTKTAQGSVGSSNGPNGTLPRFGVPENKAVKKPPGANGSPAADDRYNLDDSQNSQSSIGAARRGMGFGTKNLAAMKARTAHKTSVKAADSEVPSNSHGESTDSKKVAVHPMQIDNTKAAAGSKDLAGMKSNSDESTSEKLENSVGSPKPKELIVHEGKISEVSDSKLNTGAATLQAIDSEMKVQPTENPLTIPEADSCNTTAPKENENDETREDEGEQKANSESYPGAIAGTNKPPDTNNLTVMKDGSALDSEAKSNDAKSSTSAPDIAEMIQNGEKPEDEIESNGKNEAEAASGSKTGMSADKSTETESLEAQKTGLGDTTSIQPAEAQIVATMIPESSNVGDAALSVENADDSKPDEENKKKLKDDSATEKVAIQEESTGEDEAGQAPVTKTSEDISAAKETSIDNKRSTVFAEKDQQLQ